MHLNLFLLLFINLFRIIHIKFEMKLQCMFLLSIFFNIMISNLMFILGRQLNSKFYKFSINRAFVEVSIYNKKF